MGEGEDVIVRTGTRWVEVIISQLVLTLDDPEDGDEITTGEGVEVSIEGTATADLTAAPLDSVVVTAGDASLVATEDLAEWSLSWTPARGGGRHRGDHHGDRPRRRREPERERGRDPAAARRRRRVAPTSPHHGAVVVPSNRVTITAS